MSKKISIIIPAYNEEKRIEKLLNDYYTPLKRKFGNDFELLVVCNGCTDNTVQIVKKFAAKKEVKLLEFEKKLGKGGAIIKGFKIASGKIIGFVDADDALKVRNILPLIESLQKNESDCVIASKWKGVSFSKVAEPFSRKLASRVWNFLVKSIFNLQFKDTQAGAKFLKRKVLDRIGTKFQCSGFEFDVELLWRISRNNFKVKEMFTPSEHFEGSTFSLAHSFSMFINLLKLRFSK